MPCWDFVRESLAPKTQSTCHLTNKRLRARQAKLLVIVLSYARCRTLDFTSQPTISTYSQWFNFGLYTRRTAVRAIFRRYPTIERHTKRDGIPQNVDPHHPFWLHRPNLPITESTAVLIHNTFAHSQQRGNPHDVQPYYTFAGAGQFSKSPRSTVQHQQNTR